MPEYSGFFDTLVVFGFMLAVPKDFTLCHRTNNHGQLMSLILNRMDCSNDLLCTSVFAGLIRLKQNDFVVT
jgi:hypothetical protein